LLFAKGIPERISNKKITDTILIDNINKVIGLEKSNVSDTLFKKGLGYIDLTLIKYPGNDTTAVYYISPQLYGYNKESIDWSYPDFYGFLGERLILINISPIHSFTERKYSEKSKKFLRGLVDKCLEKKKKVKFYNMDGTKAFTDKNFRVDYMNFYSGYYLYILRNKKSILEKVNE
jgi:hypothetical protein